MINRIDGHAHLPMDCENALAWLKEHRHAIVNICVDTDELGGLDAQRGWYRDLRKRAPEHFAWITSFPLDGFGSAGWADRCIMQLREDFAAGATACKIWKNVGMALCDAKGQCVFVDDERFAPILKFLQAEDWPLMMHIADPLQGWEPLDPESPHFEYYSGYPQWHLHGRSDVASHPRLIDSRDAVVARYPKLRVVGAHFGSQEHSLDAVDERLRMFPNYFVDTSARMGDLAVHARRDANAAREFVIKWQHRIIWGMDWVLFKPLTQEGAEVQRSKVAEMQVRIAREEAFYRGSETVVANGKQTPALGLSDAVWERISLANARAMYFER